ncbi:uncharacterized protein LAESUDRAFT_758220 [Laetiporus sulphureus 93-53]|uniref:Uncharacterized protein n=1 Tax=Laetiporus sulphureus 93-53 TaxID=1314785 RepID=A0A165ERT4_9APHY|nr:uncharacterized protein LAESUDRAFT_758220 [Laetiporus sulphureus 93-53]KZT07633.1 hypothetical protein LAESUDRAFT_758220 [Laetiporus sulphureus 93-53]
MDRACYGRVGTIHSACPWDLPDDYERPGSRCLRSATISGSSSLHATSAARMSTAVGVAPSSPQDPTRTARSDSVASNSSAGGTSLRRRSRTKTRTLNLAKRGKSLGPSGSGAERVGDDSVSAPAAQDAIPPLPRALCDEREVLWKPELPRTGVEMEQALLPRRPRTTGSERPRPIVVIQEASDAGHGNSAMTAGGIELEWDTQARSEGSSSRGMKTRSRTLSLPRHAFRTIATSSDSSSQPSPITPALAQSEVPQVQIQRSDPQTVRDSIWSQNSSTSSSAYPASTVTGSHTTTESSLPYTLDSHQDDQHAFSLEIVSPEKTEFDADDVSYRLRLLMNNSYFLPPAHAKPTPSYLASPGSPGSKKVSPKSSNLNILDFFRIGKPKLKTTPALSPLTAGNPGGPVLRTTSDSTTASGYLPRPEVRSAPQTPIRAPPPNMVRVVVVRETMEDLATAAKEAERDLKTKAAVRKKRSQLMSTRRNQQVDVIDPTDAVDLPPPSSSYPFAVQASNLQGLGVRDSIGAALLAERLPPGSPGIWSLSSDDTWRKALLHEAVTHSFSSSATSSRATTSTNGSSSPSPTPPSASTPTSPESRPSDDSHTTAEHRVGQRILEDIRVSNNADEQQSPTILTQSFYPPMTSNSLAMFLTTPISDATPLHTPLSRAASPTHGHALSPAPRRQMSNPQFSSSRQGPSDSAAQGVNVEGSSGLSPPSAQALRKSLSFAGLTDAHDVSSGAGRAIFSLSPPPAAPAQLSPSSEEHNLRTSPSISSYQSMVSGSRQSDELSYATAEDSDGEQHEKLRPSVSLSVMTDNRPSMSLSEYSQPSPTVSAFHDAIFGSYRPVSVLSRRSYLPAVSGSSALPSLPTAVSDPGHYVVSPTSRIPSLTDPIASPPPQSPLPGPVGRPSLSSRASTDPGRPFIAESTFCVGVDSSLNPSTNSLDFHTPMAPLSERRGRSSGLSLLIPTEAPTPSIHSAPAPASPTAFFDHIEDAMSEFGAFDESEDEEASPEPAHMFFGARGRADPNWTISPGVSLTRLGNYSSPHIASSSIGISGADRKKPIVNVPKRPRRSSYFSKKKALLKDDPTLPFKETAAGHSHSSGSAMHGSVARRISRRRPATAGAAEDRSKCFQRESIQMFDGMLVRHLEAERDTIRRITSNMSSSRS